MNDDRPDSREDVETAEIVNTGITMLTPNDHVEAIVYMLTRGVPTKVVSRVLFHISGLRAKSPSQSTEPYSKSVDENMN